MLIDLGLRGLTNVLYARQMRRGRTQTLLSLPFTLEGLMHYITPNTGMILSSDYSYGQERLDFISICYWVSNVSPWLYVKFKKTISWGPTKSKDNCAQWSNVLSDVSGLMAESSSHLWGCWVYQRWGINSTVLLCSVAFSVWKAVISGVLSSYSADDWYCFFMD